MGRRPAERPNRDLLFGAANALRDTALPLHARVAPALFPAVHAIMTERPVRELITRGRSLQVYVDRVRALFGSWYEFFPRSTGGRDETGRAVHGTFVTAAKELDRVAAMGFDVVYLPPIHPVGTVHRKGRNNSVHAGPGDVGSPWAIGSAEGGHDAIDPELGTIEDFDAFVARTNDLGMEVALDFALQCAPDHPWVKEHPEWFTVRPDGTIAYAENPPKKYQDIYPVNFDNDPEGIYNEVPAGRAALGRARRADLPGGQPAHQAAELLALADLAGQGPVPGRAVPGRGVHPARAALRAGPARLHPELLLLHLAHREGRAHRVRPHARRAVRRGPAEPVRQHPGHPPRVAAARRARHVRHPGGAGLHDGAHVGRVLGLRAVRGRGRQARAPRST